MYNVSVKFDGALLFDVRFEVVQQHFHHFETSISCSNYEWRERLTILFNYLLWKRRKREREMGRVSVGVVELKKEKKKQTCVSSIMQSCGERNS